MVSDRFAINVVALIACGCDGVNARLVCKGVAKNREIGLGIHESVEMILMCSPPLSTRPELKVDASCAICEISTKCSCRLNFMAPCNKSPVWSFSQASQMKDSVTVGAISPPESQKLAAKRKSVAPWELRSSAPSTQEKTHLGIVRPAPNKSVIRSLPLLSRLQLKADPC